MTWLLDAAWKGSLLAVMALGAIALFRDALPAKSRHALLLIALVRFVLPFAPASVFSIFNLTRTADAPAPAVLFVPGTPPAGPPIQPKVLMPVMPRPVPPLLFGLWAAGALFVVVRELVRIARLRRALRRSPPAPMDTPPILALLDECRATMGVRRRITLASTSAVHSPSVLGLVRPMLLLPPALAESLTCEQLRFIFLHEIAHLRRPDLLVNWFSAAVQALHWFNPLVWIAAARLAEERELACDALALERLTPGERSAYASTVIELLERAPALPHAPALVGMAATRHQLKRRIVMIARYRTSRAAWPAALVFLFALVSLTNARAGEKADAAAPQLSPQAAALMKQLDQPVSLALVNVSPSDLLPLLQGATGVPMKMGENTNIGDARIDITAKSIPAHVILLETLAPLGLAVKITDQGLIVVNPPPGGNQMFMKQPLAEEPGKVEFSGEPGKIIVRRPAPAGTEKNGVTHRKITVRGSGEGQPDGTLEIEIRRTPASSAP
jgi:beta-lactamase regulating signal transducer with metallopeptidase domain